MGSLCPGMLGGSNTGQTMRSALRYFSGTGNSYRAAVRCMERLQANGWAVEEASITEAVPIAQDARLVGFFHKRKIVQGLKQRAK